MITEKPKKDISIWPIFKAPMVSILWFLMVTLLISTARAESPFGGIKAVKNLPIHGVKMIESDKGVFFVSENGRFAWKGPLYDLWNGKEVAAMEDVDRVVNRVNINKIGVKPEQLAALTLGKGDLEEVIFVSTSCEHCRKLLQQAAKLGDKYRFRVVLVPMGPKSMKQTRQLLCAQDQNAAVQALVSGNYESVGPGECDTPTLQRTLVAARVLGLRSVPYLIRHDGQVQTGVVKDLAGWLAGAGPEKSGESQKNKEAKK